MPPVGVPVLSAGKEPVTDEGGGVVERGAPVEMLMGVVEALAVAILVCTRFLASANDSVVPVEGFIAIYF